MQKKKKKTKKTKKKSSKKSSKRSQNPSRSLWRKEICCKFFGQMKITTLVRILGTFVISIVSICVERVFNFLKFWV